MTATVERDETNDVDDETSYNDRIRTLAHRARRERRAFQSVDPPDEARAMGFLRDGLGPVISLYIEARTGGEAIEFSETDLSLLHRALNDWLTLYAQCYGTDLDAQFTIREAAELLVETHNIRDTAQLLTHIPER